MGGSVTTPVHIEYFSDRAGTYTITQSDGKWTFQWGTIQKGVEVDVFQQEHLCAGHLVRNNLSKKATKHFDAEHDGYLEQNTVARSSSLQADVVASWVRRR